MCYVHICLCVFIFVCACMQECIYVCIHGCICEEKSQVFSNMFLPYFGFTTCIKAHVTRRHGKVHNIRSYIYTKQYDIYTKCIQKSLYYLINLFHNPFIDMASPF